MGGSSGPAAPAPAPLPPPQPVVPVNNYAAYQPNQMGLLAQQMQAGYGGLLSDYQNPGGIYQDMQVPVINRPEDIQQYLTDLENAKMASGGSPASASASASAAPANQQNGSSGVYLAGDSGPQYPTQPSEYRYGYNFFGA